LGWPNAYEKFLDRMVDWIKEIAVNLHTSQRYEGGMPCQEQSFQSLAGRVRSALWMRREEFWTADGVIQVLSYQHIGSKVIFLRTWVKLF
jgi:hypothetical protein